LRKLNLPEIYQEVVDFYLSSSNALLFSLVNIIAKALKIGCSGESEFIPKID
jgi:hypothetical protein